MLGALVLLAIVGFTTALACGPDFPNRVLLPGESTVNEAPSAGFYSEVLRLLPPPTDEEDEARTETDDPRPERLLDETVAADEAELEEALRATGMSEARRSTILEQHGLLRKLLRRCAAETYSWRRERPGKGTEACGDLHVPSGLPAEFGEYLQGAIRYHLGEMDEAEGCWRKLLERPASERLYRSTWAAFMVGKTLLEKHPAEAARWFRHTRELAAEGFRDSLELARASSGWEAMAELRAGQHVRAARLYLGEAERGASGAVTGLGLVARRTVETGRDSLERAAKDATLRAVVTAWILSRRTFSFDGEPLIDDSMALSWLTAVERALSDAPASEAMAGADRLAWLAYRHGHHDAAKRWLELAPPRSSIALWIRAKLALYEGLLDEAAGYLSRVVEVSRETDEQVVVQVTTYGQYGARAPDRAVLGELGALRLGRRQFVEALDALLRGGYWLDAAYVAERVLTAEELRAYVDRHCSETLAKELVVGRYAVLWCRTPDEYAGYLRYLLGRRLARAERWKEARLYLPPLLQPRLDALVAARTAGEDARPSREARSASLWEAARILRHEGMELIGTEVEPDWRAAGGGFELEEAAEERSEEDVTGPLRATPEELARVKRHRVDPEKRFHYRYLAIDLAHRAALLLPEDSEEAARILCEAGSWLKGRDPKAADRLYKTLVRRHGKTELGKEADRLRWFPKLAKSD